MRPLGGKLISVEAFIARKIGSSSLNTVQGLQTPTGSVIAWELLYLWNSMPIVTKDTISATVQVYIARQCITLIDLRITLIDLRVAEPWLILRRRQTLHWLQPKAMTSEESPCCCAEWLSDAWASMQTARRLCKKPWSWRAD
jgi:hypothetical protein